MALQPEQETSEKKMELEKTFGGSVGEVVSGESLTIQGPMAAGYNPLRLSIKFPQGTSLQTTLDLRLWLLAEHTPSHTPLNHHRIFQDPSSTYGEP